MCVCCVYVLYVFMMYVCVVCICVVLCMPVLAVIYKGRQEEAGSWCG